ncbi:serine/threonine protein kinase, partial [Archangium sp.]|uniref:serine/threonine protein kinase n=1 Tax=Archangium sp. TaxID=1872627 RepID=UPI002ED9CB8F
QRVDAKSADGRADIFALGLIFYEMLVGELPAGSYDPPSRRKPGVDPRLDGIIARCLRQAPADRYESVTRLIADLEPLLPHHSTVRPGKLSRMQRLKLGVKRVVRTTLQALATLLVLAAMVVLSVAWLRTTERRVQVAPGQALTADLGPPSAKQLSGRVSPGGTVRTVTLGDGPDPISLLVSGRPIDPSSKGIFFTPVEGQSRVGLAQLDVTSLEGNTARLSAKLTAQGPELTTQVRARAMLYGPPPDPEAALVLLGSTGRYVTLVHNGAGEPLRLEWALSERRGTMQGQLAPKGPVDLELEVKDDGVLTAAIGRGPDKRTIAEPLHLGQDWQTLFGKMPKAAFGCIEGTCRAESLTFQVKRVVPPAAPGTPVAAPPPPKRPAPKAPAPSKGKRSK